MMVSVHPFLKTVTTVFFLLLVRLTVQDYVTRSTNCTLGCLDSEDNCNRCKEGCYGEQCNTPCLNCGVDDGYNKSCNRYTGRCYECHWEKFGENCDKPCPKCSKGDPCNRTTGICSQCANTFEPGYCNNTNTSQTTAGSKSKMNSSNQTKCETNSTNNGCKPMDGEMSDSDGLIVYIIAAVVGFLLLVTTIVVVTVLCRRNRKPKETKASLRRTEENVGLVVPPSTRRDIERGPNSTYNLRGSVALLTEIDHDAPLEPLPEPQPVSTDYYNVRFFKIPVKDLEEKVNSMKENDQIFTEFADIPTGLLEMYDESTKKAIMKRNRYKGIYPYNHSRVPLEAEEHDGVKYPAYINACFVHGFKKENAYIAAQGPFTPDTMIDFWRMIWQHKCSHIVMLTNLVEGASMKCLKYWPDEDDEYGPLVVKSEEETSHGSYTVRTFKVIKDGEERTVAQFHFTDWPDKGVPDDVTSILEFRQEVAEYGNYRRDGPMIVHCSAGIGRTGTFMALDYLLREGTSMGYIDVINCVSKMRQQRVCVIQTPEQYLFMYEALVAGLRNVEVTNFATPEKQQTSVKRPSKPKGLMPLPSNGEESKESNGTVVSSEDQVVQNNSPKENGKEGVDCLTAGPESNSVPKENIDYRAESCETNQDIDTPL